IVQAAIGGVLSRDGRRRRRAPAARARQERRAARRAGRGALRRVGDLRRGRLRLRRRVPRRARRGQRGRRVRAAQARRLTMPPLFPATLAFYAVACVLYLAHLVSASAGIARGARVALAVAFASHAVDIGWLCTHGLHPVVNAREALSFASWLI